MRYFKQSYCSGTWRLNDDGSMSFIGSDGCVGPSDFTDLEDFLGPDEEDLKSGIVQEVNVRVEGSERGPNLRAKEDQS